MEHARFWWLRSHVEPHTGRKVQPCRGDQVWVFQENTGIPIDGLGERPIVVVPAELLGTTSEVLLSWSTRVGSSDPGRPIRTVSPLVDLLKIEQACGLLLEVGEHAGKDLGTVGGVLADGRVLADRSKEVCVGVGCVPLGEELVELGLWKNLFYSLDI